MNRIVQSLLYGNGPLGKITWNLDVRSRRIMGTKWCADKELQQARRDQSEKFYASLASGDFAKLVDRA